MPFDVVSYYLAKKAYIRSLIIPTIPVSPDDILSSPPFSEIDIKTQRRIESGSFKIANTIIRITEGGVLVVEGVISII